MESPTTTTQGESPDMVQTAAELQQLKGIGRILAKRMQNAGLDSFAKIAQAGEDELKKIGGIKPHNISSIQEQAKQFAEASHSEKLARVEALQQRLTEVKEQVQTLAEGTRQRFQEVMGGKCGKKLSADLVRIEDTLQGIDFKSKKGARRASKALDKVTKRVTGLAEDASLKKVRKTIKRARKAALKAVK
jgi:hypothetical protein